MSRGKLVVLCGLDGCGKTTVIEALKKNGVIDFTEMKHPPKAWFADPRMRAVLDGPGEKITYDEELPLIKQMRRDEEQNEIIPMLRNNDNVIFHRYIFSLYVYYIGIGRATLEELNQYFSSLLMPDKVIYLRIDIDEFYRRFVRKEQLSFQKKTEYVKRVIETYDILANQFGWTVIDTANEPISSVVEKVQKEILSLEVHDEFLNLAKEDYK